MDEAELLWFIFLGAAFIVVVIPQLISEAREKKKLRKAAEAGNLDAMYDLGFGCFNAESFAEAVKRFRKAAEAGDADAMEMLGHCYHEGKCVEKNVEEAARWCRIAKEIKNPTTKYRGTYIVALDRPDDKKDVVLVENKIKDR